MGKQRIYFQKYSTQNFKENYGDTVAPLCGITAESVSCYGQTECEESGVMNTCKLWGKRLAERDGYQLAQGYVNKEIEALKKFS